VGYLDSNCYSLCSGMPWIRSPLTCCVLSVSLFLRIISSAS
jgi:hypothetical protein